MMLVHFPSALFPLSFIADLTALLLGDKIFFTFSFYMMAAGVVFGSAALIFGIIDLLNIPSDTKPFKVALTHGGLNFIWFSTFAMLGGTKLQNYPNVEFSIPEIFIKCVVVAGLIFTNYLGGELVLRFGIGKINEQPDK
jgi:uncharacterized membrane protein